MKLNHNTFGCGLFFGLFCFWDLRFFLKRIKPLHLGKQKESLQSSAHHSSASKNETVDRSDDCRKQEETSNSFDWNNPHTYICIAGAPQMR